MYIMYCTTLGGNVRNVCTLKIKIKWSLKNPFRWYVFISWCRSNGPFISFQMLCIYILLQIKWSLHFLSDGMHLYLLEDQIILTFPFRSYVFISCWKIKWSLHFLSNGMYLCLEDKSLHFLLDGMYSYLVEDQIVLTFRPDCMCL